MKINFEGIIEKGINDWINCIICIYEENCNKYIGIIINEFIVMVWVKYLIDLIRKNIVIKGNYYYGYYFENMFVNLCIYMVFYRGLYDFGCFFIL